MGNIPKPKIKKTFSNTSEVLLDLFHKTQSPLSEQFLKWKLWNQWPQIVGPTIAEQTEPLRIVRGKLFVWVRNSTWLQQLNFMKDPIMESISNKFRAGFVREIQFTLNNQSLADVDRQELKVNIKNIDKLKEPR